MASQSQKMTRVKVKSTTVASLGYNAATREMDIEFSNNGDVYRYLDVPEDEYAEFIAAESKGTYLNKIFKPLGHKYLVVRRGSEKE